LFYITNKSVTVTKTEKEMNANELADLLKTTVTTGLRFTAATMLRQQQAEIEALKAENSHLKYEISSGAWNPVKELTDEEIEDIASKLVGGGKSYNILFARAILRKASEK
jgi:hypothetical protein